jgi:hypothetical protein
MKKEEYRLVETIDYAGQVKKHYTNKRDPDHALKGIIDAWEHRTKLLRIFTTEDSAYYRTLGTTYHVEMREVNDWREVSIE